MSIEAMNEEFVGRVADELNWKPKVTEFGVSREVSGALREHVLKVSTNGSFYSISIGLNWPDVPEDSGVVWAPADSYTRGKHLEGMPDAPVVLALTGDDLFDSAFIVIGASSPKLAALLNPGAREALLQAEHLHPEILGQHVTFAPLAAFHWPHIHSAPDVRSDSVGSIFVRMGEQRFTPSHCAENVRLLLDLVQALEDSRQARWLGA